MRRKELKPRQKRRGRRILWAVLSMFSMSVLFIFIIFGVYRVIAADRISADRIGEDRTGAEEINFQSEFTSDDWQQLLVNPWNKIPDGYQVELTDLINGQAIDTRAYPDLQQMMDDCRAEGLRPQISSSYRTEAHQQSLYEEKIFQLMGEGYSYDQAAAEAGTAVAVPGTSEHQIGLALDIVDAADQRLEEVQESMDVQQWLMAHSWEYGFILRYPKGKSDITGIIYEPWHYRYVGKEAAREMKELDMCLEEYLNFL